MLRSFRRFYGSMMKAILVKEFGGPEVLQINTIPKPSLVEEDVLVRVKAVGVNPVETYIRSGNYAKKPDLPFIPGNDAAGIVDEVGTKVADIQRGDKVYISKSKTGTYAEFTVASASNTYKVPGDLTFPEAAALPTPYVTAYRSLFQRASARPSDVVLVHGASGGVGIAAVQFAKHYGMRVCGTAGTATGMEVVKRAGADRVFNHRERGYIERMSSEFKNGFDVIIENAAHVNLGADLTVLAPGGRVAVVGNRGTTEINARDAMVREAAILGVMLFNASQKDLADGHAAIRSGAEGGWLKPIIGKSYPLSEAAEAHQEIIGGDGAKGKIVLTVD